MFRNRDIIEGYSLTQEVAASDEWCVEAYMETDYSQLNEVDFIRVIKEFVSYEFFNKKALK